MVNLQRAAPVTALSCSYSPTSSDSRPASSGASQSMSHHPSEKTSERSFLQEKQFEGTMKTAANIETKAQTQAEAVKH